MTTIKVKTSQMKLFLMLNFKNLKKLDILPEQVRTGDKHANGERNKVGASKGQRRLTC